MITGYCTYEKKKREMRDIKKINLKSGRPAIQGICVSCGKRIFRIGSLGGSPSRRISEAAREIDRISKLMAPYIP